jgi:peptidyl-Asp metalloendopeptidase
MRRSLVVCLWMISGTASAVSPWRLIEPVATERATAASPAAIAAARVSPALDAFDSTSAELILDLPDGERVTVQRSSSTQRAAQNFTWLGRVDGDADQQVLLTRVGDFLGGYISIASGIYELTPSAEGSLLLKLDSERFPFCAGAVPAPDSSQSTMRSPAVISGSDEPIDVLQVFSPGAITQLGGQAQAITFAQSAVDSANLAFSNSLMQARLRLVGVRLTARADSGDSLTDLNWLVGDAEVAGWRNEVRADLVGMIAEFSNACGQGYLMGSPPNVSFAPLAFQVSARSCAVGNLSYAHEHGHNIGFHHNPEDSGGGSPSFPYAFGHYVDGQFRTVMSYANPCPGGCTRRPYFSNPGVQYTGLDTGVTGTRNNALAGDQTAPIAAAFRNSNFFTNGFE